MPSLLSVRVQVRIACLGGNTLVLGDFWWVELSRSQMTRSEKVMIGGEVTLAISGTLSTQMIKGNAVDTSMAGGASAV